MIGVVQAKYGLYMLIEPLVSLSEIPISRCRNVVSSLAFRF